MLKIIPDQHAAASQPFSFTLPGSGVSGMEFAALQAPAGMTVSTGGQLSWQPTAAAQAVTAVTCIARHKQGTADTLAFNILVHGATAVRLDTRQSAARSLAIRQDLRGRIALWLPSDAIGLSIHDLSGRRIYHHALAREAGPAQRRVDLPSGLGRGRFVAVIDLGDRRQSVPLTVVR
jgi:hypothetical protein